MFLTFTSRFRAVLPGMVLIALNPCAHAMEHITLTNGFSYDCSHHEPVDSAHTRLFLLSSDGSQSENYVDRPNGEIGSIEVMPDPPKPPAPANAATKQPTEASIPELLAGAGAEHHINVELLASVIKAESNFHVDAISRAGARGLMQLMPGTAQDLGVKDITRADQNIAGGTAYLDSLLKLYKDDLRLALAAYNAGPAAVARYHGVPPFRETRAYVNRVISEFNKRMAASTATTVASR